MKPWSLHWLALFALLAGIIFFLRRGLPRQLAIAAFGALFCWAEIPNVASLVTLLLFTLSGYAVCQAVLSVRGPAFKRVILAAYFVSLILAFAVLKEYSFLSRWISPGSISRTLSLVGLSYMFFRQIQLVVDVSEAQVESVSLWNYLNFQFNAFTLLAGPIQRYQDFRESWESTEPLHADRAAIRTSAARLLFGVIKVSTLGELIYRYVDHFRQLPLNVHVHGDWVRFACVFYGYPVFLYLNFSGYCDIVISAAALVGLKVPENFNHPYLARNLTEYWTRWHISLTQWIRDYVFTPLYRFGAERGWAGSPSWGNFCFFVALFLAGVWHGSTSNYALFGALHGAGIVATKLWEQWLLGRLGGRPGLRRYLASGRIRALATFVTLNYVCLTLFFFAEELSPRVAFLRHFLSSP